MSILITGGTGSLGQYLVRRLLRENRARRIVVFSRDEQKQASMESELNRTFSPQRIEAEVRFFVGDVRDRDRLQLALTGIDTIVHAAALKIVPKCEYDPIEAVKTNVHGSENIITAAIRSGRVQKVVFLSTDKAVSPVNLYGATKLCAERLFLAANNLSGDFGPRFSVARYGNVANSRGSVLPIFLAAHAGNRPLPITRADMTRFWLTLVDASETVLDAIETLHGGEIIIPILDAFNLHDLAQAVTNEATPLCQSIGIRPGEKVHETLATEDELNHSYQWFNYLIIKPTEQRNIGAQLYPEGYSSNKVDLLTVHDLKGKIHDVSN